MDNIDGGAHGDEVDHEHLAAYFPVNRWEGVMGGWKNGWINGYGRANARKAIILGALWLGVWLVVGGECVNM